MSLLHSVTLRNSLNYWLFHSHRLLLLQLRVQLSNLNLIVRFPIETKTKRPLSTTSVSLKVAGMTAGQLGAKKLKGKIGGTIEKKVLPIETDPERLTRFCCGSNIYVEGNDVELKPDSEYPDWLLDIPLGKPRPLEELDKNTLEYWFRVRKLAIKRQNRLLKVQRIK